MNEIHPCEPSIQELKTIRLELTTAPSTNENLKRLEALESQITRREKHERDSNPVQSVD